MDHFESVGWINYNEHGEPAGHSKTHYMIRGCDTTICGAKLPHYSSCDSEGFNGFCKKCRKKYEKSNRLV